MAEPSAPKTIKPAIGDKTAVTAAGTDTAVARADQAKAVADEAIKAGSASADAAAGAVPKAANPMADMFDQLIKAQTEFAQRLGFDPKGFGFDPVRFDPSKFDAGKFGMDQAFGSAMPRFDLVLAQHQKNVGAFLKAQAAMVDGAQTVFQRQLALFQQTITEATTLLQNLLAEKDSRIGIEKQVDASKQAFEKIIAEARDLGNVVTRSHSEAFQLLNERALEQIEEIKAVYEKSA